MLPTRGESHDGYFVVTHAQIFGDPFGHRAERNVRGWSPRRFREGFRQAVEFGFYLRKSGLGERWALAKCSVTINCTAGFCVSKNISNCLCLSNL